MGQPAQMVLLLVPTEAGPSGSETGLQWLSSCLYITQQLHLASMVAFLFLQNFLVVKFLTPVPSGSLFTGNSYPLPGPPSKLHFPAPSPLHTRRHTTQAGMHKAAAQATYTDLTLSFLTQTAAFPSDPLKLCLSPS